MGNLIKTGVLLAALTSLVVLIGGAVGGQQGMLIAFVLAVAMNFGSYWFSDRIVLSMYGAQPIEEAAGPGPLRIVRRLATRAGIPLPRIYLIPGDTPNAFATGRNPQHAAVAVTEGIMRMLDDEELEGVLAHELSHVKNRDTLTMTIAATLGRRDHVSGAHGAVGGDVRWRPPGRRGRLGRRGSSARCSWRSWRPSRPCSSRWPSPERASSRPTPRALGSSGNRGAWPRRSRSWRWRRRWRRWTPAPPTAHLFIVNPLSGEGLLALFSTHPPIQERIARLRAMAMRS